ncbi:hypothetical protein EMIHUDRAFT_77886, partial [Emiliania huxleyi CCMP1516]|uniref:RRM domain-containing protein n=2 Tax=Emiliania huxleyi TaxID=2903 RepID=A0A0D3KNX7_EMIH1
MTDQRKIFIGGLPHEADQETIREDFGRYGEIEDVYLPRDRETGKPKGFGFVTYRDHRDASEAATAMGGRDYRGRSITCNIARPREENKSAPEGRGG